MHAFECRRVVRRPGHVLQVESRDLFGSQVLDRHQRRQDTLIGVMCPHDLLERLRIGPEQFKDIGTEAAMGDILTQGPGDVRPHLVDHPCQQHDAADSVMPASRNAVDQVHVPFSLFRAPHRPSHAQFGRQRPVG